MATVIVYYARGHKRSILMAQAAFAGLKRAGEKPVLKSSDDYRGVEAPYAVFYGLSNGLDSVMEAYKREATAVYIDLGYWRRRIRDRFDGYHKISVNSRHPTAYFQQRKHDKKRFLDLGLTLEPWRTGGRDILVAGMSHKAAIAEGLAPLDWERVVVSTLQTTTKRILRFRPKPNCCRTRPIAGTVWYKRQDQEAALNDVFAVVARHSNMCVDALVSGIPVFCEDGVASVMGLSDLSCIETPIYPDNREQWAADVAWTQFTPTEMATPLPWLHLKEEGLIP